MGQPLCDNCGHALPNAAGLGLYCTHCGEPVPTAPRRTSSDRNLRPIPMNQESSEANLDALENRSQSTSGRERICPACGYPRSHPAHFLAHYGSTGKPTEYTLGQAVNDAIDLLIEYKGDLAPEMADHVDRVIARLQESDLP